MHVTLTDDERAFREECREFFESRWPGELKRKQDNGIPLTRDDHVRWQKILHEQGWAAINWPVEYGGTGWTPVRKYLFANEIARANAPDMVPFGVKMVAPVIYTFGSEEQKKRFLPDILESNVWWCQGYSEPGAGSDLASLKTRADRDGDHYVARRQEGISFLLVDMSTPGVTVKPIITIEGDHEVNEVHFENVRVPVANLVGEEGKGWTYGKVLLQHERTNIAGVARSKYRVARLKEKIARPVHGGEPLSADRAYARKLAALEAELHALEFTELRTLAAVAVGKAPGPESSILKIKGTEIQQAIDALFVEAAGYYALPFLPQQYAEDFPVDERIGDGSETQTALRYFNNRKASIYGGSNEIQKNIISKHVLGL